MEKRIAIGIMAALLLLVVTAAYAPNPGTVIKDAVDKPEVKEDPPAKKLQMILDNQKRILDELKSLKETQEELKKDIKWIRARS